MKVVWLLVYIIFISGSVEAKFGYSEKECNCTRSEILRFAQNGREVVQNDKWGQSSEGGGIVTDSYGERKGNFSLFYADTFCGGYIAKGTSIRNSWSGSIVISGIPAGSTIRKAFLYWMTLGSSSSGNGNFNGNTIVGDLIGQDIDPCWSCDSSYAFRKDVTIWVTGNSTYSVSFSGGTYGEGASLVVLYEDNTEPEQVFLIYDGNVALQGSFMEVYQWTMGTFIADNPVTSAKVSHIIADGQTFLGAPLPDSMYYNSTLLDWNYTEGRDGPYWDTPTYDVTAFTAGGSTQAQFRYVVCNNADGAKDCVNLEACVLAVSKGPCPAGVEEEENSKSGYFVPSVFPIPSMGSVMFKLGNIKSNTTITIYDCTGRIVRTITATPGTNEVKLSELKTGIYFYRIENTLSTGKGKFVIL